jgi:V/A-type H+-transporting ATPase subunit A
MALLQQEAELSEIVRLVGVDALSARQRMIMETSKSLREDFLYQSAFDPVDTYCSMAKQYRLLKLIMLFHHEGLVAVEAGKNLDKILDLPVRERIGRARFIPEDQVDKTFTELEAQLRAEMPR